MQPITIGLVQVAYNGNQNDMIDQYRNLIPQAVEAGAQVVGLPEFSLLPYFPGTRSADGFQYAEIIGEGISSRFFSEVAKQHGIYLIGSQFEQDSNHYYDTAVIYSPDGQLVGRTRKVHIPSGDGYHETDFFGGWHEFPVWNLDAIQLAAPTCYDQWFPELARIYGLNGAELIFYPTAIGSEPTDPDMDSSEMWLTIQRSHAIANGVFVAAANRVGHENAVTFYGSSFICDPMGNVLAQAGRDTTEVITATLDPAVMARWRGLFPLINQRQPQTYQALTDEAKRDLPLRFQADRQVNID